MSFWKAVVLFRNRNVVIEWIRGSPGYIVAGVKRVFGVERESKAPWDYFVPKEKKKKNPVDTFLYLLPFIKNSIHTTDCLLDN